MVLGLLWPRLRLGPRAATVTFWAAVYGTFANWATTLAAAVWGAGGGMMPLAGGEGVGTAWQEGLVAFGLGSLSLAMVLVVGLALRGLRRPG